MSSLPLSGITEEEYEEYLSETPLEARFDISTIELLVLDAIPKHKAYDLTFEEYLKERSRFAEFDNSERKQISFYMPTFCAKMSIDLAVPFRISNYRFIVLLVELGLIHLNHDCHDSIFVIKTYRSEMIMGVKNEESRSLYMHLNKSTITMGSCHGSRSGSSKHFVPHVSEWMYDAIHSLSADLNMSTTDLVYICWCIGVASTLPRDRIPPLLISDIESTIQNFQYQLSILSEQTERAYKKLINFV